IALAQVVAERYYVVINDNGFVVNTRVVMVEVSRPKAGRSINLTYINGNRRRFGSVCCGLALRRQDSHSALTRHREKFADAVRLAAVGYYFRKLAEGLNG